MSICIGVKICEIVKSRGTLKVAAVLILCNRKVHKK